MTSEDDILYLGRGRFPCRRANLIQSLRTTSALVNLGYKVHMGIPPSRKAVDIPEQLRQIGIANPPRIEIFRSLHPRLSFKPFPFLHRRLLKSASCIYTRVVDLSMLLIRRGHPHHLEIHDTEGLVESGKIKVLVAGHRDGVLCTLVPISHSAAKILVEHGAVPERVHVAPSGVDLAQYEDLPPFDPTRLTSPRILHAGTLAPDRGEEIFAAVANQPHCNVTIVGRALNPVPGTEMRPPVAPAMVPSLYGDSDLILMPYQPELPRALTMSPVKVFESMAAGRPIIASDLPTIREVLRHEENALIVPPADPDAWIDAIDRLRNDPVLAQQLADQARRDASGYSWRNRALGLAKAIGLREPSATA